MNSLRKFGAVKRSKPLPAPCKARRAMTLSDLPIKYTYWNKRCPTRHVIHKFVSCLIVLVLDKNFHYVCTRVSASHFFYLSFVNERCSTKRFVWNTERHQRRVIIVGHRSNTHFSLTWFYCHRIGTYRPHTARTKLATEDDIPQRRRKSSSVSKTLKQMFTEKYVFFKDMWCYNEKNMIWYDEPRTRDLWRCNF